MLETADVTVGYDSSAVHPKGDTDPTHRTPAEAIETLANAGYDLLNTLDWNDEEGLLEQLDCPISIGQGHRKKAGKLGVGNCTAGFDTCIKGCPPKEEDIYKQLKEYILGQK